MPADVSRAPARSRRTTSLYSGVLGNAASPRPPSDPARADSHFGPFRLLPARQLLLEDDRPVALGSRALDLLTLLVARAGELVTKEELFARVWPDVAVDESNLRAQVASL